jgi:dynein heavy chain
MKCEDVKEKFLYSDFKFTLLRRRKEEFRSRLLNLIIKSESSIKKKFKIHNDKDLSLFYYYIKNGLNTLHVAPIDSIIINNILLLIPKKYKYSFHQLLEELLSQIKDEYLLTMKRSVIDFAFQDFSEKQGSMVSYKII